MTEPNYKLTYFDFRGLGEGIRWQFTVAGVPFEDYRVPRAQWDEYKQHVGWGLMPVLHIDEIELTQAHAIGKYLAKRFKQLPETDLQNARCDELVNALQDLRFRWRDWLLATRGTDSETTAMYEKRILEKHFPFYFAKFNKLIEENGEGSGFAVGKSLTWADLFLASILEIWTDNHGEQILDGFPALKKQKETVLSIPQIKEWAAKRPKTQI